MPLTLEKTKVAVQKFFNEAVKAGANEIGSIAGHSICTVRTSKSYKQLLILGMIKHTGILSVDFMFPSSCYEILARLLFFVNKNHSPIEIVMAMESVV